MTSSSDKEFILTHFADDFETSQKSALKSQFEKLMKEEKMQQLVDNYRQALGHLQISLQTLYLDDTTTDRIRSFVVDMDLAESEAAASLKNLSLWERLGGLRNRMVVGGLVLVLIYGLFSFLKQDKPEKIKDILQALHYESLAMESDPEGRLDLPTDNFSEVQEYFSKYPSLNFTPDVFKEAPSGWKVDGATVIDYTVQKVAVTQYSKSNGDKLFHFSLNSSAADLPKSEAGQIGGPNNISYYAYTSENYNIIAWHSIEGRLSLLVSRLGGEDMAKIVQENL